MKILNVRKAEARGGQRALLLMRREPEIHRRLDHPNVVRFHASFEDPDGRRRYFVMELCTGGTLLDRVPTPSGSRNGGLESDVAANYTRQALDAVCYLHAKQVAHRDIKLDNFAFADGDP